MISSLRRAQSSCPCAAGSERARRGDSRRWGLFEGTLTAAETDASQNPFTDVDLTVKFTHASAPAVTVTGFYDGDLFTAQPYCAPAVSSSAVPLDCSCGCWLP